LQAGRLLEWLRREEPQGLEVLWAYLEAGQVVDPQVMVYVTRLLGSLLAKGARPMLGLVGERGGVPALFIRHLGCTPAADFLCRLLEMEQQQQLAGQGGLRILAWLDELDGAGHSFFTRVMGTIGTSHGEAAHFALSQFLHGLLMRPFGEGYPILSLLHRFTAPLVLGPFLQLIIHEDDGTPFSQSSWTQGIAILSTLCAKIHEVAEPAGLPANLTGHAAPAGFSAAAGHVVSELVQALMPHLPHFASALEVQTYLPSYQSPGGPVPRLGMRLITAARLFADLTLLRSADLFAELGRLRVTEQLLELFFAHPQNSFLQHAVTDYFARLCQGGDWALSRSLILDAALHTGRLLTRITQAQRIADSFAEMPRRPRPNFMGHVTLLADQLHALLDKHGAELYREAGDLLRRETWIEYSNKSYRETKLRDAYVLGGEPAPPQPLANEEVFTAVYSSAADESAIRYFCHEIISNLPPSLHLADLDDFIFGEDDEDDRDRDGEDPDSDELLSPNSGILGATLLGNRGGGFENILGNMMDLELRLQLSLLDDDEADFDLGPDDSEDEHLFDPDPL